MLRSTSGANPRAASQSSAAPALWAASQVAALATTSWSQLDSAAGRNGCCRPAPTSVTMTLPTYSSSRRVWTYSSSVRAPETTVCGSLPTTSSPDGAAASWASTPRSETACRPFAARSRTLCRGTTDSRAASVPQSEDASSATTLSRRTPTSMDPVTATVVVLPTPPLMLSTTTRRLPTSGIPTWRTSSRSRDPRPSPRLTAPVPGGGPSTTGGWYAGGTAGRDGAATAGAPSHHGVGGPVSVTEQSSHDRPERPCGMHRRVSRRAVGVADGPAVDTRSVL